MLYLDSAMNNTTLKFQYPKPQCVLVSLPTDTYVRNQVITAVYATLIPLIITVNLLSINGIIKTKRKKLNSSQILFLILFASDIIFGALQLPVGIYIFWKKNRPTCFELLLNRFSITFPIIMSGSLLCVISADRYINVVSNTYYRRIVTKKLLPVAVGLVIVTSFAWATFEAFFLVGVDKKKVGKAYIVLATYCAVLMVIGITINVALLTNVKSLTKNSTNRQSIGKRLTKTIAIIVATFVTAYLQTLVIVNILAYAAINTINIKFLQNMIIAFYLALILTQINVVLNSVIYLARNTGIKKYYCNLFSFGKTDRKLQNSASMEPDVTVNPQQKENFYRL